MHKIVFLWELIFLFFIFYDLTHIWSLIAKFDIVIVELSLQDSFCQIKSPMTMAFSFLKSKLDFTDLTQVQGTIKLLKSYTVYITVE